MRPSFRVEACGPGQRLPHREIRINRRALRRRPVDKRDHGCLRPVTADREQTEQQERADRLGLSVSADEVKDAVDRLKQQYGISTDQQFVESLQKYHHFFGDDLKVACPTGSGRLMSLWSVAADISRRLSRLFHVGADGRRPVFGGTEKLQSDPHWRGMPLFYEYFHGDNGAGLGASHQTGWTGVVAKLLSQSGE